MSAATIGLLATACYAAILVGVGLARRPAPAARRFTGSFAAVAPRPTLRERLVAHLAARYADRALALLSERRRALIRHRLDAAGLTCGGHPRGPRATTLRGYAGLKAAYTLIGGVVGGGALMLVTGNPLVLPAAAYAGWLSVDFSIGRQGKRRQHRIDRDLPDFLDILAVVVGAGSGFRQGLARVAAALGGPLGEEVTLVLRQMDLGASRRTALEGLRDRNDSEQLATLVTALLQAEELGAPLTGVLGEIAVDMRRAFHQAARKRAAQAAPRVSLIVSMLIVPGAIALILAAVFIGSGVGERGFLA